MVNENKIAAEVINIPAKDWLTDTYLPYALYVIRDRALVDVSGMKPVARRILWSMYETGVTPNSKHLKASRCASNAVAYHPHGASSVEGALAGMAQGFNLRVPLIDPSGSVGKVKGDVAAAARYWEARLTKAAMDLLKEIPDGAVELGMNYDGELAEPKILPVRWPVEIVNGTQGIAVGYASKMAPHNPTEVIEACRRYLKNPNMTVKQLMKVMPGPDFPTGGEVLGVDAIEDYYKTGSGSVVVRGRYNVEQLARGKVRIVFYELPYDVSAEDVMSKINALQNPVEDKKTKKTPAAQLTDIAVVKDLTDRKSGDRFRLTIETKPGTNYMQVVNDLFAKTPLETKFPVNATVLVDNNPVKSGMLDLIKNFVDFRKVCTINKAQARIKKIDKRVHQLEGILAVLIDIDKAIAIIRKSDTADIARQGLMKAFKIDEGQADYILSMQLRRLTKQDSLALKTEVKDLRAEQKDLNLLLKSEERLLAQIDADLLATKKVIGDERKTVLSSVTMEEIKAEQKQLAAAAKEANKPSEVYVTRFANGTLLRSEAQFKYTTMDKKFVNSPVIEQFKVMSDDSLVVVCSDGVGRRIPVTYLAPNIVSKAAQAGLTLPRGVAIVGIAKNETGKTDVGFAMATANGKVKIAKTDFPKNSDEFPVFTLDNGDSVVNSIWLDGPLEGTFFTTVSANSNILLFDGNSIRPAGAKAGGVAGMKLKDGKDKVISFNWVSDLGNAVVLSQAAETIKATALAEIPSKGKGGQGVALHGLKKTESVITQAYVGTDPIIALDRLNNRVPVPPVTKRAARGSDLAVKATFGSADLGEF